MTTERRTYELCLELDKQIMSLKLRVADLETDMESTATQNDLTTAVTNIDTTLSQVGDALIRMEEKLKYVVLPEDTRRYLKEEEITKLLEAVDENKSVLSELQKATRSMVALMSKFDLTH